MNHMVMINIMCALAIVIVWPILTRFSGHHWYWWLIMSLWMALWIPM